MKESLGIVETRGLAAAVNAADAMAKAAKVRIKECRYVGSGLVSVSVTGEVAAVKAAVDSGKIAAAAVGELVSYNVIPSPHDELEKLLEGCGP
jgi:microcompartment protein CcmL/EutN